MATLKKKRFTLDLEPGFQRRLKATAALKGVNMRQYCIDAVEKQLDADAAGRPDKEDELDGFEALIALRDEIWKDKGIQKDSTPLIRQMREESQAPLSGRGLRLPLSRPGRVSELRLLDCR